MDSKIIIDSTAFYAGLPFRSLDKYYTTPHIGDELQRIPFFNNRIETLLNSNRLQIIDPSSISLQSILKNSLNIENKKSLSDADISILALAKDFISEDYSVIVLTDDLPSKMWLKNLEYHINRCYMLASNILDNGLITVLAVIVYISLQLMSVKIAEIL